MEPIRTQPKIHQIFHRSTFSFMEIINNFIYLTQTNPEVFPSPILSEQEAVQTNDRIFSFI